MKKLPVLLITGFLGAGKTTFLNQMLHYLDSTGKKYALLINEFGKISIDKELLEAYEGSVYEVNQGSVFCVCTRDQFISALDSIAEKEPPYDLAIIESTGIANTGDLGNYLISSSLSERIDLKQNFCLIDALNFHKVYVTLPAVKAQVTEASILIINKTDLVTQEYIKELEGRLKELNPHSPIIKAEYGKVDFSKIIDFSKVWTSKSELSQKPPEDISSVTLVSSGLINTDRFISLLENYKERLMRVKGFLRTDKGQIYLEWYGEKLYIKPLEGDFAGSSRVVIIGYMLDTILIKKQFYSCIS